MCTVSYCARTRASPPCSYARFVTASACMWSMDRVSLVFGHLTPGEHSVSCLVRVCLLRSRRARDLKKCSHALRCAACQVVSHTDGRGRGENLRHTAAFRGRAGPCCCGSVASSRALCSQLGPRPSSAPQTHAIADRTQPPLHAHDMHMHMHMHMYMYMSMYMYVTPIGEKYTYGAADKTNATKR